VLLQQITLRNLLSFKDATVELKPLNILIGENTAGKSNLIEAISLLQAAPSDLRAAVLRGGGVRYWIWLGEGTRSPTAELICEAWVGPAPDQSSWYTIEFAEDAGGMAILSESLAPDFGESYFNRVDQSVDFGNTRGYSVGRAESVFALFKNPADTTPTTRLGKRFENIQIYREFLTGPRAGSRQGGATTVPGDVLRDGGDNLATVLQELHFHGVLDRIKAHLNRFSDRMNDVIVRLDQGIARTFVRERGLTEPLPSVRMSDGTLKFLCLLAVLSNPEPPPLVCIEEPEQGLHPDAIQIVAQALREASERTQLIVTTHSRELIDAFTDEPESVLVCSRDFEGGTQCRRLTTADLDEWLQHYSLGQLWRNGEIGGNRW
jgi:predicted ATPase